MSIFSKYEGLSRSLSAVTAEGGRNPFDVVIERPISSTVGLIEGRETLLFGTNNYLGLSQSPAAIEAAVEAARKYGVGTTGSRIANGTQGLHRQLEARLAAFFRRRHCMVFSTGYQANLGTISALAGKDDYLLLDADSHASIYDGSRLGHAQVIRFRHNDADDLRKRLRRLDGTPGAKLIVVEGIYSMMGDVVPMAEFAQVKRETGAWLLADEAHSVGVMGEHGRGVAEADGVEDDIDFVVGTFSKSLGTVGGYCVSNHDGLNLIRLCSRPYMFTASLPPEVIAATMAALDELENRPELRHQLMDNARRLHAGLNAAGLRTGPQASPVVSVILDDVEQAVAFWNRLLDLGVYVNLSLPPATPDQHPLLRTSVMATHTPAQVDQAVSVFAAVAGELGINRAPVSA
ncbi:aminotransferase class I/II-fold pyridoxal phosphate-dependent enzyme [Gluconacetobacter entanii]|uniref:Aminotransferase class I/II-fold pyridoxal phosphate-dependent enzyme n=1 Tax=Gluconacetobacter entanii TaxID=108528 RepID=A0ABT3K9L3_9PROT|nr:aminotransferase class I/II-fold pyridoxal phosphate-dependent enzyme [Gluconacetobacter entanii]MBE7618898.1 aminotransferase class I/II-fold pyridoxal phosphate-dependent enzyme [Komagataeibacter sp. FXV2]MCW4592126.1 aminotransferase class I/II-fold pyridoxal phosphate-dependent enzyme [Gluconacetobacter entanii]MCW4595129.1 aminotransferase class I/II-fold pyridoxal phosphate-dependent enzyme [Gluconacetobacter entanii]NPC88826.1 aminotransferase class I/II-fold pyridoxal phosphate-depen